MKNYIKIIILSILITLFATLSAHAESAIVEQPEVKIIIDGEQGSYDDVPLNIDGRTMLPLRQVLIYLGVSNDEDHIQWNGDTRTITIVAEEKTIVLTIDSTTAYVNGEEITLDVAPMIYSENGRTYIPARFVSENLDKKVVWDGTSKAILMTDESKYEEIKSILSATNEAMGKLEAYEMALDIDYTIVSNNQESKFAIAMDTEFNVATKTLHSVSSIDMDYLGLTMNLGTTESYSNENTIYSKSGEGEPWFKEDNTNASSFSALELTEEESMNYMASGLTISGMSTDETLILEGDAFNSLLASQMATSSGQDVASDQTLSAFHMYMTIDRKTNYITSMQISIGAAGTDISGTDISADLIYDFTFDNFDSDFDGIIPQNIVDTATEKVNPLGY